MPAVSLMRQAPSSLRRNLSRQKTDISDNMRARSLHNCRGFAWILSIAFVLMATVSGASWQCLDGHPCPPGCTMQHRGEQTKANGPDAPHACCTAHAVPSAGPPRCALCSTARPKNAHLKARCTSPVCVLRTQVKPDVGTQTHAPFALDVTAVLFAAPAYVLVSEETGSVSFGSSRAPPDRGVVRLSSPRAPPVFRL